jgi:tetratricopeptide (TPR) repeat protein
MSRLTRKEMKRDEVLEGLSLFLFWLREHSRALLLTLGGLVVAALAGALVFSYLQNREIKGQERLADAIQAFDEAATGSAPRAQELFEELRGEMGGTDAAAIAGAYLGELAARDGDLDRARSYWEEFVQDQGGHLLAGAVRVNLMELDRAQGQGEELATRLRAQLSSESTDLPTDLVLYQLALTLDRLDRSDEAQEVYRRLAEEHPQSVYATEARSKSGLSAPAPSLATFGG